MPRQRGQRKPVVGNQEEIQPQIIKVREKNVRVRIRSGPGTNYVHVGGEYLGSGVFEVDEVRSGIGSISGWGHLVNGKGWVALDFLEILE